VVPASGNDDCSVFFLIVTPTTPTRSPPRVNVYDLLYLFSRGDEGPATTFELSTCVPAEHSVALVMLPIKFANDASPSSNSWFPMAMAWKQACVIIFASATPLKSE
jgi:hypothetical protein